MADKIPDPRTFESWEDAFQYPIPAVRGMEKKLRINVAENKEKLRTLVGDSYRDLLGTARQICDADEQMHKVERLLVNLGQRSDSRILDRIAGNQARLAADKSEEYASSFLLGSQLSLLQKCLLAVSGILRTHASLFLAAKLLVIARNLHRALTKEDGAHGILETLGNKLAFNRQRVLRRLDKSFRVSVDNAAELVANMTAFSLVTSSTATDVLRHFQHIRLQAIKRTDVQLHESDSRLRIYLDTQQEARAVFPELLQASLKAVASRPLLQDKDVTNLTELALDLHLPWISPDAKNFTPYARHEALNHGSVRQLFDAWTATALTAVLEGVQRDVDDVSNLEDLIQARKKLLQMWLSSKRYPGSSSGKEMLDKLRLPFLQRLSHISEMSFDSVYDATCQQIDLSLRSWDATSRTQLDLWELSSADIDLSDAATAFRKAVRYRRHGSQAGTGTVLDAFEGSWREVQRFQEAIQSMKEARWEEGDDDDEDSDDEYRASDVLSKQDPGQLHDAQKKHATEFLGKLEAYLNGVANRDELRSTKSSSPGFFLLRIIRELRRKLPRLLQEIEVGGVSRLICSSVVSEFQQLFISGTLQTAAQDFDRIMPRSMASAYKLGGVWESSPSLPVQISPGTFRLLRNLVKDMDSYGADVWSPQAVGELRQKLGDQVARGIEAQLRILEREQQIKETPVDVISNGVYDEQSQTTEQPEAKSGDVEGVKEQEIEEVTKGDAAEAAETPEMEATKDIVADDKSTPTEVTASMIDEGTSTVSPKTNEQSHGTAEPEAENDDAVQERRLERLTSNRTQVLFDILYLDLALSSASDERNSRRSLSALATGLIAQLELQETSVGRLRKASADHWRRTYLLFGLLCT